MMIDRRKIENILAEKGLTMSALASKSGISRQSISTIIRRSACTPATAGKLAKGLGASVEDIRLEVLY